jgi:integrase
MDRRAEDRREAERWLRDYRQKAQQQAAENEGDAPMSFAIAASRWWNEKGQHRKDERDIERFLAWLVERIGRKTPLAKVDANRLALLIAERRRDIADARRSKTKTVSPATVNRSVIEPLRAILTRADRVWGQKVARIEWAEHRLDEGPERVRVASDAELEALFDHLRPDLHPVARFLLVTGVRLSEACGLTWGDVDMREAMMRVRAKGGRDYTVPLADAAMAILSAERGRHPEFVFTYTADRTREPRVRGHVYPILPDSLAAAFWRAKEAAGLRGADLRLHDFRHTAATRTLRATGNLAMAQRQLGHARIETTSRYAHVMDDDLRAGLNAANPVRPVAKKTRDRG